jgi:hypothetical protein
MPGGGGYGGIRGGGMGGFGGGMPGGGYGGGMPMPGGGYGGMMPGGEGPVDPQMRELMKQDNEMDRQTHELALKIREARGDDRTKLKNELADLVAKHFDVRQKRREHQLQRMEDELKRLKDTISKRNSSRDTIIDNHVKELVGDPRDLDF